MSENLNLVLVTVPNIELAKTISKALIEDELVACINILPGIISIYKWENKLQEEQEHLLICKSIVSNFKTIADRIKSLHSYSVPEIISVPVTDCEENFKNWVGSCIKTVSNHE